MSVSEHSMLHEVSIIDIKQNFSKYLQQVEDGVTLLIVKAGKPMAEIKPVSSHPAKGRPFGLCHGEFTVPDNFDEPLPEGIIHAFEGR